MLLNGGEFDHPPNEGPARLHYFCCMLEGAKEGEQLPFFLGTEVPRHSAGCVGTYVRTWYVAFRNAPAQVLHALHS